MKNLHCITFLFLLHICLAPKMLRANAGDSATAPANSFYFEAGGKAYLYSLGYERKLLQWGSNQFRANLSASYMYQIKSAYTGAELLYVRGRIHSFEVGTGFNLIIDKYAADTATAPKTRIGPYINNRIGYRYQTPIKGLLFRVSYTPIVSMKPAVLHWVGLSLGYSF